MFDIYHTFLILHILSVIAWMVGLLYLPRLFVYHVDAPNPEAASMLALMEKRLLRIIANPAMIVTWMSGLTLIGQIGFAGNHWLHLKLLLVLGLSIYHMLLARWRRQLAGGTCPHQARFFRIINEIPSIFAIFIVSLVILKPF